MAQLSDSDSRNIREMWAWYRNQKTKRTPPPQPTAGRMVGGAVNSIKIQAPNGGIPARVGTRAGKATCTVLETVMTGTEADIITTTTTETVYNHVTLIVLENGERIGAATMHQDGKWWASVGDCNDEVNP